MQIAHRKGWKFVGNIHAKTHEHMKSETSKAHNLAMLNVWPCLVLKPLDNKEFLLYI